jgi:hypothetical protein
MIKLIASISILLNSSFLPISMEQARNFTSKLEEVEPSKDLKTINTKFFNRQKITFKKLVAGEDLAESGKGSIIYFAYANDGSLLAAIKQLPLDDKYDKEELEDEVLSLHERYFINVKNFKVPKLIGTAEFSDEKRSSAYIIETIAQGKSINSLVKDVKTASGIEKHRKYEVLKRSVAQTAKAFAELHKLKQKTTYSNYYDNQYANVHSQKFEGPYGMIHGDAHLGNIFYDDKSGTTTFIDLSFMPESLKGAPVGLDSGKFIFTLEAISLFYGLDQKKSDELISIYKSTYLANNKQMSEELLNDYTMLAYKDYAYPEENLYASDRTDQGSFLYKFAKNKITIS